MRPHDRFLPPPETFHAGIVTARFFETWDFYTAVLGFHTEAEVDGQVRLRHPGGATLDVLAHERDGPWPELVNATDGRGLWFTLAVEDPDVIATRAREAGVVPDATTPAALTLRDPNGVLVLIRPQSTPNAEAMARPFLRSRFQPSIPVTR